MTWISCFTTPFLEDKTKNEKVLFYTRIALICLGVLAFMILFSNVLPVHAQDAGGQQVANTADPFTVLSTFLKKIVESSRGVVSGLVIIFATLAIFSIISGARSPQSKSMAISWLFWVLGGYVIYMLLPAIINFVQSSILTGGN